MFLPTAVKFHYTFTLRDLSNVFQGVLFSEASQFKDATDIVRLWAHETIRVYSDKLVDAGMLRVKEKDHIILLTVSTTLIADQKQFLSIIQDTTKKGFEEMDQSVLFAQPLIYSYVQESGLVY